MFEGKHLVIDAQCLQTDSMQRGIGRYSTQLVFAMAKSHPQTTFTLLLNRISEPLWDSELKRLVLDEAPSNIVARHFESPTARQVQFAGARRSAEASREEAIHARVPDAVLILSAFQRERETILAKRELTGKVPTFAILYDLIPLYYPRHFLYTPSLKREYLRRLAVLKDCDGLLAISEATARSWVEQVGVEPRITVIGGAAIGAGPELHGLPIARRRGVLCLGAETPNKNLGVLLAAHAELPREVRYAHPLTITGIRDTGFRHHLQKEYKGDPADLVVPGYVNEQELDALLSGSRVLVMPSSIEGLGLPVLEAMTRGTPCIVANGSSLREMSTNPETHFQANDPSQLGARLREVLTSERRWQQLHASALADAERSSWPKVAHIALSAMMRPREQEPTQRLVN